MQKNAKEIRVTAKTADLAIKEAASLLNTQVENVAHRIVSQTNGGFFSFLGKKVEIAAWAKNAQSKSGGTKGRRGQSSRSSNPKGQRETKDAHCHKWGEM